MLTIFTRNSSIFGVAALALDGFSFFQLPVGAQSAGPSIQTLVVGESALVGLAREDMLRFSAFNPLETESGQPNESISLRFTLYLPDGTPIAKSPQIEIPPGEFRWVDFKRDDLLFGGESSTGRAQFLTKALWGLRTHNQVLVTTKLEIVDRGSCRTREVVNHSQLRIVRLLDATSP